MPSQRVFCAQSLTKPWTTIPLSVDCHDGDKMGRLWADSDAVAAFGTPRKGKIKI
jgi:hypothetical protein